MQKEREISKKKIVEQIKEDWSEKLQSGICIEILNYLLDDKNKNISHLTFGSLNKVTEGKYSVEDLMMAVQYLSGDKVTLLEIKFELNDDNNNCFDISKSELKEAIKIGTLVHPDTGELIRDFEKKVSLYFQPSLLVKDI